MEAVADVFCQATVFQGEQLRGSSLVAAKSIFGQLVTPRLLELSAPHSERGAGEAEVVKATEELLVTIVMSSNLIVSSY